MKGIKNKVIYCVLAALVIISLGIWGCAPKAEPEAEGWEVPVLIFTTGALAPIGMDLVWAINYAGDQINAAGGISGRPIVLPHFETACDPTKALSCFGNAIDRNCLATIGPSISVEVKAVGPRAVRDGMFFMSMYVPESVTSPFFPWTMWVGGSAESRKANLLGMWLERNPDIKSVVFFLEPEFATWKAYVDDWSPYLEETLGVEVLGVIEHTAGRIDVSPIVVRALALNPDGFILILSDESAARVAKELITRGAEDPGKILVHFTAIDKAFFEIAAGAVDGIYVEGSITREYGPRWEQLVDDYAAEHSGEPPHPFVWAFYDAVYMIKHCFESEGITGDPAKVKEERIKVSDYMFNQVDFPGCKFTFDVVDGIGMIPVAIYRVENNESVLVDERD